MVVSLVIIIFPVLPGRCRQPAGDRLDIFFLDSGLRRHRNRSPRARTAAADFPGQVSLQAGLALVLRGYLVKAGADDPVVDAMAAGAAVLCQRGRRAPSTAALGAGAAGFATAKLAVSVPRTGPTRRFCSARLPWALRALSGRKEATCTDGAQSFMQATLRMSPCPRVCHMPSTLARPLRFGSRCCTSADILVRQDVIGRDDLRQVQDVGGHRVDFLGA